MGPQCGPFGLHLGLKLVPVAVGEEEGLSHDGHQLTPHSIDQLGQFSGSTWTLVTGASAQRTAQQARSLPYVVVGYAQYAEGKLSCARIDREHV